MHTLFLRELCMLFYSMNEITSPTALVRGIQVMLCGERQHLNLSGWRKQVYLHWCKLCCGFGRFSWVVIFCVPQLSGLCGSYGTSISTHASMMAVARKESSGRLSTLNLVFCSRSHSCTVSADSPLARWVTWLYLVKKGAEKYGLWEPGERGRVDTGEP